MKTTQKRSFTKTVAVMLGFVLIFSFVCGFTYEHDPMENPKAVEDIVVNPDAVYGFSPNPDSKRLGPYADAIDWTDEDEVEEAKQIRIEYHTQLQDLYNMIEEMMSEGKNVEEIARAVSRKRNEIRLESVKDNPEGLAAVKQSNLETYGDEEGPTIDYLYSRYGSWQTIIEKSLSSNPGMDACLGLYDEMYDTYDLAEEAAKIPVTYTVVPGDCLWKIAQRYYGEGKRWTEIYEANKEQIAVPQLIYVGQVFIIP